MRARTVRRSFLTMAVGLLAGGTAAGQSVGSSVYSKALPPSKESLERLNLYSEWSANIPMEGQSDGLAEVQVVDAGQIFVQTRAGLLVAVDAATGEKQWTFRYPRPYANIYPVGVTRRLVFATSVARLYCFHRYTGLLEFVFEMPAAVSAGPVADEQNVYLSFGATKASCYRYPQPVTAPPLAAAKPADEFGSSFGANDLIPQGGPKGENPADAVARRYTTRFLPDPFEREEFEPTRFPPGQDSVYGDGFGTPNQPTPSVMTLPRVSPPYTMHRYVYTPSVSVLPSLRQPYTASPSFMRYNQRTPSVAMIPPSVARVAELTNLMPEPVSPKLVWDLLTARRLEFQPVLTGSETNVGVPSVWYTTAEPMIYSVAKKDRSIQVIARLTGVPVAPGAGPVATTVRGHLFGYFPLDDGTVMAVDLSAGDAENPMVAFRSFVGGRMNYKPVPTRFGTVYAAGDNVGVAGIDMASGAVVWRTAPGADRLLGVNEEFAYVMDRRSDLLVYDKTRVNDRATLRATPLAKLPLTGFNVPVTNPYTDRLFVGADNGILICLRSNGAKYAKPLIVAPPTEYPPVPADEGGPADPDAAAVGKGR